MSNMTLRLDTAGLRSLIAENPTFAVEIQQAVLNNIRTDNIEAAVRDRVNACLDKMAPRENYYSQTRIIKDQKLLDVINGAVRAEVSASLKQVVEDSVRSVSMNLDLRVRQEIQKMAKSVILESLTAADAKAILLEKLV